MELWQGITTETATGFWDSGATGIKKVALGADRHQSALRDRLSHPFEALASPDFGEILIFEITHTELREKLTGDDIAIRKDIHSGLDRVASRLVLGWLVASHDEGTHVVRVESGIVSKLQSPLRRINPGDRGIQLIDEIRVKSEVV